MGPFLKGWEKAQAGSAAAVGKAPGAWSEPDTKLVREKLAATVKFRPQRGAFGDGA